MDKKKKISIAVFVIGLITLVAGVVFLIIDLMRGPEVRDGDYLVSVGKWQIEDEPGVIWDFTEIGKGKLTTNNHLNTYDFLWAIEDGKLKIETDWLYTLNNEYEYRIENGDLILTREDLGEIKLSPGSSVDAEVGEDDELIVGD